ncbi:hypothetical protein [Novilysobacter erysipheiresistens]|uniref:Uncharacterized protein n=1 Tax=Novilysobacter erysipheiresistens TaxID=1749332 RepID=A0ABU7YUW6_9GAMM
MSETITLPLYDVLIGTPRNATTLSAYVPKHEIEVLRAMHGPANVRVQGETDDEIELNVNADAEWSRLFRRYRRLNDANPLNLAFRAGPSALEAHGFDLGRGRNDPAPQSSVIKHKKPAKADAKKAKAEKAE